MRQIYYWFLPALDMDLVEYQTAKFLKWNKPPSIFRNIHYHFRDNKMRALKLVSQQYRVWSDCIDCMLPVDYIGDKG